MVKNYPSSKYKYNHFQIEPEINKASKIIKYLYLLIIISHLVTFTFWAIDDYSNKSYLFFIGDIIGPIFVFLPVYTSFAVISAIFIKYYSYLLYLKDSVSNCSNGDEFGKILNEYKIIRKSFAHDYNLYLKWCIFFWLFEFFIESWTSLIDLLTGTESIFYDMAEGVTYITDFAYSFLFVYASGKVSETFETFQELLYESGKIFVDRYNDKMNYDCWAYNYLLQYALKYPLRIEIGGFVITKRNAVKFLITFGIARLLSYAAHYFYQ